ncbi:MAG: hypothetical protein ABH851_02275, partial [Methanobacteriota archaeon]
RRSVRKIIRFACGRPRVQIPTGPSQPFSLFQKRKTLTKKRKGEFAFGKFDENISNSHFST